jgi:chloramphenicol 3-O-phosphotransferase
MMSDGAKKPKGESQKKVRVMVSRGDDLHVFDVTAARPITPAMIQRGMVAFSTSFQTLPTFDLMQCIEQEVLDKRENKRAIRKAGRQRPLGKQNEEEG